METTISIAEAGRRAGVSRQTIWHAVNAGELERAEKGLDAATFDAWLARRGNGGSKRGPKSAAYLDAERVRMEVRRTLTAPEADVDAVVGRVLGDGMLPTAEAQQLRIHCEARLLEIKLAREAGQVCEIAEAKAIFAKAVGHIRTRLLSMPAELAPRLSAINNPVVIQSELLRAVNEALEALSSTRL